MINTPYPFRTIGTDLVCVSGSFTIEDAGGGTDTVADVVGFGATPARTADGVYTLTFPTKYPYLQCAIIQYSGIVGADNADSIVPARSYSASTGVLTMTFEVAAGTDTVPTDEGRVDYFLIFQTRTVLGQV
jgi:hypothetical protein